MLLLPILRSMSYAVFIVIIVLFYSEGKDIFDYNIFHLVYSLTILSSGFLYGV